MRKEKFLIVGSGGREGAFAKKLAQETELYAVIGHENPSIVESVLASGGHYIVANSDSPEVVLQYAQAHDIDYVFVSADKPLAMGVVDVLLEAGIKAVGGTQQATKIEWDKVYSIDVVHKVCPEFTPFYQVIHCAEEVSTAIKAFKDRSVHVVVKPQGLTGGKGVKVMPEHLETYQAAEAYARHLLVERPNEKVLLVEKLEGIEFTVMGLTDGKNLVLSPASYDYPFRLENDLGAGTGGMGCFTSHEKQLPFMTEKDLLDCQHVMQSVIDEMRVSGLRFNGVLNGGFFVTPNGIRFMEFNARFGDPESLNVLSVLQSSFAQFIRDVWHQRLSGNSVSFIKKPSVVKYLVAQEYPHPSQEVINFSVDQSGITALGLEVFFASAVKKDDQNYATLKTSRVLAIGCVADTIEEASQKINQALEKHVKGNLCYRKDIGSKENLEKLETISKRLS